MVVSPIPTFSIQEVIKLQRENTRIKTQNKSCHALSCRLSGESLFYYNDTELIAKRGDVLYIPQGSSYEQECVSEEIVCIHLDVYGFNKKTPTVFTPDNPDEMCNLFQKLSNSWEKRLNNYQYCCTADLYNIIAQTDIFSHTSKSVPDVIEASVRYLEKHIYDSRLSLEVLCEESHISKTCFIKHFRDTYECTPIQYINFMRVEKAKILLESKLYTRDEVAFLCGFNDVKYFYVVFKKLTGMTAGEFLAGKGKSLPQQAFLFGL